MTQYSRVTYEDRCHISAWIQDKNISVLEMADRLGFHKSTIYREIKRNSVYRGYHPKSAHNKAKIRYQSCRKNYLLKSELKNKVEEKLIKDQWSPEQISRRFKLERVAEISHECIYQHIRKNKNIFQLHLRRLNRRAGVGRYKQKGTHTHSFKPNISERPNQANKRVRLGDLERDVMFAGNKTPILVCTDRKSRFVKIARAENLKALTINELTLNLIHELPFKSQTLTSDRGTEFKVPLKEIKTYYCDPQTPQQRGTVENTIGLIRQYIKRSTDPKTVTTRLLNKIEFKLNNRPRKVLGYLTPFEVVTNQRVALAS